MVAISSTIDAVGVVPRAPPAATLVDAHAVVDDAIIAVIIHDNSRDRVVDARHGGGGGGPDEAVFVNEEGFAIKVEVGRAEWEEDDEADELGEGGPPRRRRRR